MDRLLVIEIDGREPEIGGPEPDRIVAGTPIHRTWNLEEAEGGVHAGVWESTPGEWRVHYTEWEFCEILSGVSVLRDESGSEKRVCAGDAFVIRPGFRGTWRVEETTRKRYVIRL